MLLCLNNVFAKECIFLIDKITIKGQKLDHLHLRLNLNVYPRSAYNHKGKADDLSGFIDEATLDDFFNI